MSPTLDFSHPPLALLTAEQQQRFDRACDIVFFPGGARPLQEGAASAAVYFIIKGHARALREREGRMERLADYGPGDVLGAFAVMQGRARFSYEVSEDLLCHAVDAAVFSAALTENPRFAAWFQEGLSAKRQVVAEREHSGVLLQSMLAQVTDAPLAPLLWVAPQSSLREARRAMKQAGVSCLLVGEEGEGDPGIITRTDVLDALALQGASAESALAPWVQRPLIAVDAGAMLFQALVLMTERAVERVVVRSGEQLLGTLGVGEVLSHYASWSHVIGQQLARARDLGDVREAAQRVPDLIRQLHAQGAKIGHLMELVSAINTRLLNTVFQLVVPPELQSQLCLLVLGSEGRREQIVRTDQDNALIHVEALSETELDAAMQDFTTALLELGFPPCPGRVMVNNPHWRASPDGWTRRLARLTAGSDPQALMELAMLLDARPVAGDERLFAGWSDTLWSVGRNDILLHHFAAAALEFATPLTLFGRLRSQDQRLDIKKGGIFPLVHGLRALALKHAVQRRNSFARADALVAVGALSAELGRDVQQALAVFQRLRLGQQLEALQAGDAVDDRLALDRLRRLDRDLLRDALGVVDAFKHQLRQVFAL